ncbi:MAG: NUDIX hydrolase [Nitrososphaerota archaeon]|jgi:ADP-ribose pyrophosphatase YjhB (NUDIX family)|nr:NUDIX hydrolase [Nitrososphaerota archaeon]MDG6943167.1 NUDIX hydrolase [Nitrososphaerota archaeon]MDG6950955.1 NUDIX hydrolase [Nitrososphaerota archaeon]
MTTNRRFCRFSRRVPERGLEAFYTTEIPEGGLCLSSFLVIEDGEGRVLMGHLDPAAPWDHIGALDPGRAAAHSSRWMLPSSHLMLYESPQEAARRVLKEQLGISVNFTDPTVIAEVGTPKRFSGLRDHWDFEFVFRGTAPGGAIPVHKAWKELRYVDLKRTSRREIARSHDDVLENIGFAF